MSSGSHNAKLFINYRREDTAPYAGRLYDRLTAHFGQDRVFIDIDQIEPGEDFVEAIKSKVGACDIAIVSIGPNWLSAMDASGKRRLDDSEDFVRMEIIAALERKIRVIPVLVGGARMPRKQDLPEALAPLSRRNAIELSETRFHADVSRLIEAIERPRSFPEKQTEPLSKPVELIAEPAPPARLPSPEDLQKVSALRPPAEQDAPLTALLEKRKVVLVGAFAGLLVTGVVGGWWFGIEQPRENAKRQRQEPNNVTSTETIATPPSYTSQSNVVPTQSPMGHLTYDKDKVSYSIGLNIGSNLARQNVEINLDSLIAGVKDGIAGKPQLTEDQVKEVMTAFEKDMQAKQKAAGEKSAAEGAKFLEENKKKEGVKTTGSGLQYKVIKEGTGAQPKATDTVTVNYRGTLIGGKEFDSSYKRGQPATFALNGVIKGWTEGLQLMKAGSKYQLFIPPGLAYGERAVGPDLPANSTLIFEVELLESKPSPKASPK